MSDLQDLWNNDREQLRQVRLQLTAALRESADAAAQRDTALGLCLQRERELAEARAERDLQCRMLTDWERIMGEMRTALDLERNARAALGEEYISTRAALARSEARVKAALAHADGTRKPWAEIGPSMVEALRG